VVERPKLRLLNLSRAIPSQNIIGWLSLLNGLLPSEWMNTQDRYYKSIASRRTGRRWAIIDFIQELWSISFAIWMHHNDRLHNSPKIDECTNYRTLTRSSGQRNETRPCFISSTDSPLAPNNNAVGATRINGTATVVENIVLRLFRSILIWTSG